MSSKSSDAIDNASISHLGYELHGYQWVEKTTRVPTTIEEESDEEAKMDIPPPSPTHAPSPPPPTIGVGSSAAPPDWCQNLS